MSNVTILFDFDGVYNSFMGTNFIQGTPAIKHQVKVPVDKIEYTITYSPVLVSWFNELVANGFDVRWLTTWRADTERFPELFGFSPAPWIPWNDTGFQGWGKFDVVKDMEFDRLVWVDDDIDFHPPARRWADSHPNVLPVVPNTNYGLTFDHLEEIRKFINEKGK